MRPFRLLAIAASLAGLAAIFVWLRPKEEDLLPPEPLEPIVESPRPPVRVGEPMLQGRADSAPRTVVRTGTARSLRNQAAREHALAVRRYEAGIVSIEEVEKAELALLDARHFAAEIDDVAWHRGRAVLYARFAERARLRVEAGMVPAFDLEVARLQHAREESLAGDRSDYPAMRHAFFELLAERNKALTEGGFLSAKAVEEERKAFEEMFPP